jgi:hypothetical protein
MITTPGRKSHPPLSAKVIPQPPNQNPSRAILVRLVWLVSA